MRELCDSLTENNLMSLFYSVQQVWKGDSQRTLPLEEEKAPIDIEAQQQVSTPSNQKSPSLLAKGSGVRSFKNSSSCDSLANITQEEQQVIVCAICLGPYSEGDLVVQSCNPRCQHEFHHECISEWLVKNDLCPCCRQIFLEQEVET